MPRLLIIDPSMSNPEVEGCAEVAAAWGGDVEVVRPVLGPDGRRYAATAADSWGAVVLLGSEASVHDQHPWLLELAGWLRPVMAGAVPFLGLCFGHQLLAALCGGEVRWLYPDHRKRLGIETSIVSGGRLVDEGSLEVVVSHREHVSRTPPGFRAVGQRPEVPNDILEHTILPLFGCQFHAEGREEFARNVGLASGQISASVQADGRRVLRGFCRLAQGS